LPIPDMQSFGFGSVLAIIVVFGLLVLVHELGHFLLAKRAGILCREFALGLGPKIFRFKRGETEYTIRLLPIGGLVRMAGEDPELDMLKTHMDIALELDASGKVARMYLDQPGKSGANIVRGTLVRYDIEHNLFVTVDVAGDVKTFPVHPQALMLYDDREVQIAPFHRQFRGKTLMQRFWAIFAGPAANFLLAFILFGLHGFFFGVPVSEAIIGEVKAGGPAAKAGLMQGDRVLSVDGQKMTTWEDFVAVISKSPNQKLTLVIERNGTQKSLPVQVANDNGKGKLLIYPPEFKRLTYAPVESMKYGFTQTYTYTVMIFAGLVSLVTGNVGVEDLSGPVGIFTMTSHFAQQGIAVLMKWAAILSINLGLFNLLPLPALDGGRIVFLGVEALRGKPVDPQKEGMVHFLGFAFLMLLIIVVTWNDIQRF